METNNTVTAFASALGLSFDGAALVLYTLKFLAQKHGVSNAQLLASIEAGNAKVIGQFVELLPLGIEAMNARASA